MFPFGFFKKALVGLGVVVCFNGEVLGTLMSAFPLVVEGDTDSFVVEPTLAIGGLALVVAEVVFPVLTPAPPGVVTALHTPTVDQATLFPLPDLTIMGE